MKILINFFKVLFGPADNCNLFPIIARVGLYGIILFGLLLKQSENFDSTELLTLSCFCGIVTIIELMWSKVGAGKTLIWHFAAMILLVSLTYSLLNKAHEVENSWKRNQVLQQRVENLIATSPAAIIIVNERGRINYLNGYATDLLGYKIEQLIDCPIDVIIPKENSKDFIVEGNKLKPGDSKWINVAGKTLKINSKTNGNINVKLFIFAIKYHSPNNTEFYLILQSI